MLQHTYNCLFEGTEFSDKLVGSMLDDLKPQQWNES